MSPRLLALLSFTVLASVALVVAAPSLQRAPLLVQLALLGMCAAFLPVQLRIALRPHRPMLGARLVFLGACAVAVLVQLLFVFTGVYFSDDSVRHVYDGHQLLAGRDVYAEPPAMLGRIGGLLPNHPELPTIYLPFTQMQAVLGALLSPVAFPDLGFPLVYHLCLACGIAVAAWFLPPRARRLLILLALSPYFLFASSSRHADAQGFLLVVLSLALVRSRSPGRDFAAGFAAGLLPGLKPLGVVWMLFLAADVALRRRAVERQWFLGMGAALLLVCCVGVWLWSSPRSLAGFLETGRHFADWFVAYNPFVLLKLAWTEAEQRATIVEFRREMLTLLVVGLCLMPLFATARMRSPRLLAVPGRRLLRRLAREILVWTLLLGVLWAAVWHPWYFLWWIPALALSGRWKAVSFLPGLLVLFYLPVASLRFDGRWDYGLFVFAIFCYVPAWFWLTRNRRSGGFWT